MNGLPQSTGNYFASILVVFHYKKSAVIINDSRAKNSWTQTLKRARNIVMIDNNKIKADSVPPYSFYMPFAKKRKRDTGLHPVAFFVVYRATPETAQKSMKR